MGTAPASWCWGCCRVFGLCPVLSGSVGAGPEPALRAGGTVPASPPQAGCGAGSWCPRRGAQGLPGLRAQQRAGTSATAPHVHPPGPFRGLCPARCARFTRSCASPGDTRVQVGTAPCTAPHPQRSARPPGPLPPPRRGAFLAKLFLLNNAELLNLLHFSKLESAEAQRAFSLRRQQSAPCLLPDGRARQLWGGGFALRGAAPSWGIAAAAPSSLGFCPPHASATELQQPGWGPAVPTCPPAPRLCAVLC